MDLFLSLKCIKCWPLCLLINLKFTLINFGTSIINILNCHHTYNTTFNKETSLNAKAKQAYLSVFLPIKKNLDIWIQVRNYGNRHSKGIFCSFYFIFFWFWLLCSCNIKFYLFSPRKHKTIYWRIVFDRSYTFLDYCSFTENRLEDKLWF